MITEAKKITIERSSGTYVYYEAKIMSFSPLLELASKYGRDDLCFKLRADRKYYRYRTIRRETLNHTKWGVPAKDLRAAFAFLDKTQ